MRIRTIPTLLLAAALTLPGLATAADKPQPLTRTASAEARATVVAVDLATRLVTLKGEDGKTFQVQAGDAVQNLDKVKAGDVVAVTYTESLAFEVVPKGEKPQGVTATAERLANGGQVGRTVTTFFKVDAYDPDTHVLWGTTADGITKSTVIKDPKAQERAKKLIPGNVVQVTYTESLAVKLEKTAK